MRTGGAAVGAAGTGGVGGWARRGGGATSSTVRPPTLVWPVVRGPGDPPRLIVITVFCSGVFDHHERGVNSTNASTPTCATMDHVMARFSFRVSAGDGSNVE